MPSSPWSGEEPAAPGGDGRIAGSSRRSFAAAVAAAFLVATAPRLLLHEMWRDEAWLWLVVTDSRDLVELFAALARSGQGYLFPLLCELGSRFSEAPQTLQLLHLVLATAGAWTLASRAPFDRTVVVLLLLGYFLSYEYAVISRHYALGVLLAWVACAASHGRRPALGLGAALGLLLMTTVYGYILGVAILSGWMARGAASRIPRWEALAGMLLGAGGAIAGFLQLVPAPGTSFAAAWRLGWDPGLALRVLQVPARAFLPLPDPRTQFWNTHVLDAWPLLQAGLGGATLLAALALAWPLRPARVTFAVGSVGFLIFAYVKLVGEARHHGHLWLLLVAALWVGAPPGGSWPLLGWRRRALLLLATLHALVGLWASWADLRHPFSNGPAAARLIRERGLHRYPLLGYREPPAAGVALPLGLPLWSPSRQIFTTHPDWGPLQRDLPLEQVRCAARELAERTGSDVVLVMNRELPRWPELTTEGAVTGAIESSEDYHLYRLRRSRLRGTASAASCGGP